MTLRALFFGSSAFAVPSLEIAAVKTQLAGVVTQPDRPAGRGKKWRATPVKECARRLGIPVHEPEKAGGFAATLAGESFDLFLVASYGKLLPESLLRIPRLGALNVHPSLLPRYRGATPIQGALLAGDQETGVTIMLMDAGMDTGDVVLQERMPIAADESYGDLHDRLARFGALALSHAIDSACSGHLPRTPQRGKATVTRPIAKNDLELDWNWDAQRIVNHVRAYSPAPAARARLLGVPLKILRARVGVMSRPLTQPGDVVGLVGDSVTISCGEGSVDVLEVIAPNRAAQSGAVFAAPLLRVS